MIIKPARKQTVGRLVKPLRDWCAESITMKRGLTGAKPEKVAWWVFEAVGAEPDDDLADLFPGSGAVLGYRWLVTHTLEREPGASLRAAGFVCVGVSDGGAWDRSKRKRKDPDEDGPKLRWEIDLAGFRKREARLLDVGN